MFVQLNRPLIPIRVQTSKQSGSTPSLPLGKGLGEEYLFEWETVGHPFYGIRNPHTNGTETSGNGWLPIELSSAILMVMGATRFRRG